MKVLLIDNYPAPYRAEQYNLMSEHCELTVVYAVGNDKTRDKNYKNDNMKYNVIWLKGVRVGTRSSISFSIKKIIKKGNYDVILVGEYASPTSMIAMDYMHRHKMPFLFNADGGFVREGEAKWKYKFKRHFLSMPTAWLTSGAFSDKYLTHYGAIQDRIYHYPFAFNYANERYLPTAEEKIALKKKVGIIEDKNILYVGRAIPVKRLEMILRAFSHVNGNVGLYIVGVDKLPEEYDAIVKENNMTNVHVIGFKKGQALKDCYLASDAFVLFSESEVWGLVINEAMTNGCPVIASDNCIAGIELIKSNDNGILVPSGNEEELTKAMQKILDDDKYRAQLSSNAYNSLQEFNIENNAKKHLEIIEDFYKKYVLNNKTREG